MHRLASRMFSTTEKGRLAVLVKRRYIMSLELKHKIDTLQERLEELRGYL